MKRIGTSLIAFGGVSLVLSVVGGTTFDCLAILLILTGFAVRNGTRAGRVCGIVLSVLYLFIAISVGVTAAVHGASEIGGVWQSVAWSILGIWAWFNWMLLLGVRISPQTPVQGDTPEDAVPQSCPSSPSYPSSPSRRFQFSLRSVFMLMVIVALACWSGIRHNPSDRWGHGVFFSSKIGCVGWYIGVVGYRSGVPVTGYLWREEGQTVSSPSRVEIEHDADGYRLMVDGSRIKPEQDFVLYVNDADGSPLCLRIPKEDAIKVFGRSLDQSRIENFWETVVKPQRHGP